MSVYPRRMVSVLRVSGPSRGSGAETGHARRLCPAGTAALLVEYARDGAVRQCRRSGMGWDGELCSVFSGVFSVQAGQVRGAFSV